MKPLLIVSTEIKSIVSGAPSPANENDLKQILSSKFNMQHMTLANFKNLDSETKLAFLVNTYFNIICSLEGQQLKEFTFIIEVIHRLKSNISTTSIEMLQEKCKKIENPNDADIAEAAQEVITEGSTSIKPNFTIKGFSFTNQMVPTNAISDNYEMPFSIEFNKNSKINRIKEVLVGVDATLNIKGSNKVVLISQAPVKTGQHDFFFIDITNHKLTAGDYFILNQVAELIIHEVTSERISGNFGHETVFNEREHFTIGSDRFDNYFNERLGGASVHFYKEHGEWFIKNNNPKTHLMLAFHKYSDFDSESREIVLNFGETKKVMVAGNYFQFINPEVLT